jgi:putative chitinase
MITTEKLRQFSPRMPLDKAEVHVAALEQARQQSTVNTARRLAHLLGQLFVESGGFTVMEENLNFKSPERLDAVFKAVKGIDDAKALIARGPQAIGNRVYANRLGNGDEASGDGFRYRGSGYIQLTGRANYKKFGAIVNMDLESKPELAREPAGAARLAFSFWDATRCSLLADAGDVEAITMKINGTAMLGLAERREATLRAMDIWPE